jgi:hypothetical protein
VRVDRERFIATDRYAIGVYTHGAPIADDVEPVTVPREAAKWLGKQTAKMLGLDSRLPLTALRVTIVQSNGYDKPGSIRIHWENSDEALAVHAFEHQGGNYPPVERLVTGWKPATDAYPVILNGVYMSRFTTSVIKLGANAASNLFTVELGKSEYSGKPAAIRVTIGDKFTGLLQPNLPTR